MAMKKEVVKPTTKAVPKPMVKVPAKKKGKC